MITVLDFSTADLLAVKADGEVSASDYKKLVTVIDDKVKKYGSLKWYYEMGDDHFWTIESILDDIDVDFEIGDHVEKCAIVNAGMLEPVISTFISPMIKGEIRFFEKEEKEKALEWLREQMKIAV